MYTLRPNQVPAVEAAVTFFNQKDPNPEILVAPTAFGKSIVIGSTVSAVDGNTLVLQPTKELLEQNYTKYIHLGGRATVYSASFGSKRLSNTVFATIGSIKGIGPAFQRLGFKNMIIDEIHMYPRTADSMLGKFMESSGIKKVLGFTATAFKLQSNTDLNGDHFSKLQMLTSRSKHGQFFKGITHVSQIQEMVERKYWSELIYELHDYDEAGLLFNNVKSDYTETSLKSNYENQHIEDKIVDRMRESDMLARKSVIIFVPTIADAISLARRIPGACAVHSDMDDRSRTSIINGFRSGSIPVVVNVNMLSTGFDHPGVDAIVHGRRTASLAWLYQANGRGTRILQGKENCLIVDFVGNTKRFGKIEHIYYKKKKMWQVYGEGGKLMTGLALDQIGSVFDAPVSGVVMPFGVHKDKDISSVPKEYLEWMLREFNWSDKNYYLKEAAEKMVAATA
jgi:DNA repair protein RadD